MFVICYFSDDVVTEEALEKSQLEYQQILEKELRDQTAAKSSVCNFKT